MILPKNVLTLLHSLEIDLTPREKLQHTKHCQEIRIQPKISNIYCADLVCILFSYSVKFEWGRGNYSSAEEIQILCRV